MRMVYLTGGQANYRNADWTILLDMCIPEWLRILTAQLWYSGWTRLKNVPYMPRQAQQIKVSAWERSDDEEGREPH